MGLIPSKKEHLMDKKFYFDLLNFKDEHLCLYTLPVITTIVRSKHQTRLNSQKPKCQKL